MSSQSKRESGIAKMRPRSRLISVIGNELISDESVAVVELVKNSYDADAHQISVVFDDHGRLTIQDDGHGMNLDTVLNAWLEPGTLSKRVTERSPSGRLYQGAKGIGRFAAARLAKELYMETQGVEEDEGVCVVVDWGQFEDDSYLDEISLIYETKNIPDLKHGTRITLHSLRRPWTRTDFEMLERRLSRLLSPFGEINDLSITLEISNFPDLSGKIGPPELILHPAYALQGEVNTAGEFSGQISIDNHIVQEIARHKLGSQDATLRCGPFAVEIRAWNRELKDLKPLGEQFNFKVSEVRKILNEFSGVSVYRDGFRVYPYGEMGNDWLGLDLRSRLTPTEHLANNQIIAAVRISRVDNPGLQDRSNREGFIKNDEYAELQERFKEILKLLELARTKSRKLEEKQDAKKPQPRALFERLNIDRTVQAVEEELGIEHHVALLVADTGRQVKESGEKIQEIFSRLLFSAGLGQVVDIVMHEIGAPAGKIRHKISLSEKELEQRRNEELSRFAGPVFTSVKKWADQILDLRKRLDPHAAGKRGRATLFPVLDEIQDCIDLYSEITRKNNIIVEVEAPEKPIKVTMPRSALGQIFANMLDNSVYWTSHSKLTRDPGRIIVQIENLEQGFLVRISDTGPGVAEDDLDYVFDSYFSRKPEGIGLGLYIASLIIEPFGQIRCLSNGNLKGACFEARFEKGVVP